MLGLDLMRKLADDRRAVLTTLATVLPEDCFRVVIDACVRQWVTTNTCNLEALTRRFELPPMLISNGYPFVVNASPKSRALLDSEAQQVTIFQSLLIYRLGEHMLIFAYRFDNEDDE